MTPVTDFLSCTDVLDDVVSLSPPQRRHTKTYVTGLIAVGNKTVTEIVREIILDLAIECSTSSSPSTTETRTSLTTNMPKNCKNTESQVGHRTVSSSSTIRSTRKPGTPSPASAGSKITPNAMLSGVKDHQHLPRRPQNGVSARVPPLREGHQRLEVRSCPRDRHRTQK
jgi:hypothetical protein